MTSDGTAAGFFAGVIDETRIWNYARSQAEIQTGMNQAISSSPGLIARWGLNEGSGTIAYNSNINNITPGTLTNGPTWVAGAPALDPPVTPPVAPSGLAATATSAFQVNITWTDNSDNESGFEIERSTTGSGGTYSLLATVGSGITSYNDVTVSPTTEYCYRVRAVNGRRLVCIC